MVDSTVQMGQLIITPHHPASNLPFGARHTTSALRHVPGVIPSISIRNWCLMKRTIPLGPARFISRGRNAHSRYSRPRVACFLPLKGQKRSEGREARRCWLMSL